MIKLRWKRQYSQTYRTRVSTLLNIDVRVTTSKLLRM